jgi:cyanoexosortase A
VTDPLHESAPAARERWLFWAAVVVATIQMALAVRLAGATADYPMTVTAAWAGVLFRLWENSPSTRLKANGRSRAIGSFVVVVALFALVPTYRAVDRLVPLLAGLGLFLVASGPRGWLHRRAELMLLALPVINPIPGAILDAIGPTRMTTWCAMMIDRALGHPVTADGSVLRMPGGILEVISGCSGATSISRLCVLAILIIALFPTSARQRVSLFASAFLVGFVANAARVALIAAAMSRGEEARYDFWHDGTGATIFSIVSTAVALGAWWVALALFAPSALVSKGSSSSFEPAGHC